VAKGDFYTFKEIEKIATQQKKIVVQSVKDILQSLVDDNLVSTLGNTASIHFRCPQTRSGPAYIIGPSLQMLRDLDRQK